MNVPQMLIYELQPTGTVRADYSSFRNKLVFAYFQNWNYRIGINTMEYASAFKKKNAIVAGISIIFRLYHNKLWLIQFNANILRTEIDH